MRRGAPDAAEDLAARLTDITPAARGDYLRQVMAYAAGGLVALEGPERAAEAAYRVGVAVVKLRRGR